MNMIAANEVQVCMNEAGARRQPFLFGVDFELSEGFFVLDPLGQQEILFEVGGVSNSPMREGISGVLSEKMFSVNPMAYEVYREKFAVVREGLARGDSFLLNLTVATGLDTNWTLEEIFHRAQSPYRLLVPGRFVCFSPEIFAMVRNISESVIIPIAGLILTFIACYELIQLIIDHNNLANFETWIFFKWVFKTFVAVMLITNTFNITMAVFDVAQHVVNASGGIIAGNTAIDASGLEALEETLQGMDLGPLIGLLLQSFVVQITMSALAIIIFVIVYGRMIEIYLMVSLAPIPFSTFANREQNQIGQNYLRSLFALGFQGFLIIICVGIYAVLVQSLAFTDDIIADIWGIMGYTVLLCFTLFKTGTLAKSVFNAH